MMICRGLRGDRTGYRDYRLSVMSVVEREVEIRHLRAFVAVAEELHFSRAAVKLHLAQQALSHQIALRLPRFGGQVDYAAWVAGWWWILASYSTGVR